MWSVRHTFVTLPRRQDTAIRDVARAGRAARGSWLYFAAALASHDLMQREPGVWVEGPDGEL